MGTQKNRLKETILLSTFNIGFGWIIRGILWVKELLTFQKIVSNPCGLECPAGYYCVAGSSTYTICSSGTYQDVVGQSTRKTCMEGFYCDNSNGPITNYTTTVCPSDWYLICIIQQASGFIFVLFNRRLGLYLWKRLPQFRVQFRVRSNQRVSKR